VELNKRGEKSPLIFLKHFGGAAMAVIWIFKPEFFKPLLTKINFYRLKNQTYARRAGEARLQVAAARFWLRARYGNFYTQGYS
jgi:hypothetical protein